MRRLETLDALHEATRAIATQLSVERVPRLIVDCVRPLVAGQYPA